MEREGVSCDLQIFLDCPTNDQIEIFMKNTGEPMTQHQINVARGKVPRQFRDLRQNKIKEEMPKPFMSRTARKLRVGLQSSELRQLFNNVKKQVPGRQEEAQHIYNFITMAENGTTTPICLHGNTGCGKTSLIAKIAQFFQDNSKTVISAYVNCMTMWSAYHVYAGILQKLYKVKQRQPQIALYQRFKSDVGNNEYTKIIILDEIDQFVNDQKFFYNMLDWLSLGGKIILVLISNVIDLTVKLDSKLQSRLKFETVIFKPYSYKQIEDIINLKYPDIKYILQKDAVTFVAKKIANINSDIRLLEKICNRLIVQFHQMGGRTLLNLQVVSELIYQENGLPEMLTPYTLILQILHKGVKKADVSTQIIHTLFTHGKRYPQSKQVLQILCDLQQFGLITLTTNRKNCDLIYHDYGIKIHQQLHELHEDQENN